MNSTIFILLTIISLLGITILNPMCDALIDKGNKSLSKNIELIRDFCIFLMLYAGTKNFYFVLLLGLAYSLIRYGAHNLIYNLTYKHPWYYYGSTSQSDYIEKNLSEKFSKWHILASRIISIAMGCLLIYLSLKSF